MKLTRKTKRLFAALLFAAFALVLWAGITPPVSVSAAPSDTGYEIIRYDVKMDVAANRVVTVEENLTVVFSVRSSGIIRDFPLEWGDRYTGLSALRDGAPFKTSARSDEDSRFLSFYLGSEGDYMPTRVPIVYTIFYTMTVAADKEEGYLSLDVVGYGTGVSMSGFTAEITVPDGLKEKGYIVYSGRAGTEKNERNVEVTRTGNTLYLASDFLGTGGVTLDLSFESGVLTTSVDPLLFISLGVGAALILLALLLKFIVCRQPLLVKPVGLEAPKGMDPLLMGAVVDNKVDGEDLGALVFWLAAKGYLKIDLSQNDEDPTLIRVYQKLPPETPTYITTFFEGLFRRGDAVRVSSLKNNFFMTADAVKQDVNKTKGKLYKKRGPAMFVLLLILSALVLGGLPLFYGMAHVALSYHYGMYIPLCVGAFFVSAMAGVNAAQRSYKWKKSKIVGTVVLGLIGGVIVSLFALVTHYAASIPVTGMILGLCSAVTGAVAGSCDVRTEQYNEQLGLILGFKDFILYTEKDRIKVMLEEDPELYYNVLPYAQVLGVSDVWADKFKGLDAPAPTYVNHRGSVAVELIVWNRMFRTLNRSFASTFVSRPSTKGSFGSGGGRGGGFGHGHGGGGHGGGGTRRF